MLLFNGFLYAIGYANQDSSISNYCDLFILKIDTSNGNILNSIIAGGLLNDSFTKIKNTSDGHILVIGYINSENISYGNREAIIVKLDSDLVIQFCNKLSITKIIHPTDFIEINSEFYITGFCNIQGSDQEDLMLLKIDTSGIIIWCKIYDSNYSDVGTSIMYYNNKIHITGQINDWQGGSFFGQLILCSVDTSGNLINANRIGTTQPIGASQLLIFNSNLLLHSIGHILQIDTLTSIIESTYLNLPVSHLEITNWGINGSVNGDFKMLVTDTSFLSCSNTNPPYTITGLTLTDTLLNISFAGDSLLNNNIISTNILTYSDSTICILYTSNIEIEQPFEISIFPNPVINYMQISIKRNPIDQLMIYDNYGKLVYRKEISGKDENTNSNHIIDVNVEALAIGVYILKLHINGNWISKKIIIIK